MHIFTPMQATGRVRALFFVILVILGQSLSAQVSISSISPVSGPLGTAVTISGSNFSPVAADNIVYFGAVQATVSSASATSLSVIVPAGASYQPVTVTTGGLTAYSGLFDVTFPGNLGSVAFPDSTYLQFTNPTVAQYPSNCLVADIDGDGKPDLISYNSTNTISVFKNTSSGNTVSFAARMDFSALASVTLGNMATGDINGDGKMDVILGTSSGISVFINTSTVGNISFAPRVDFSEPAVTSLSIADIDKDGLSDIVFCNVVTELGILRNTTSGGVVSFAPVVSFTTDGPEGSGRGGSVVTGDLNGDGLADIVVTNGSYFSISLFPNTSTPGNISLGSKVDVATGDDPFDLTIADFDGDGKKDIAVATMDQTITIMQNTSTGGSLSFARGTAISVPYQSEMIAAADIDGDGKPDLGETNGGNNSIYIYHNTSSIGSFSFSAPTGYGTTPATGVVVFNDMNGDGPPEMIALGSVGINVIKNNIAAPDVLRFTPVSGSPGDTIRITGTKLSTTNAVSFGNMTAASFSVVSDTVVTAVVGMGASGGVGVSTTYGVDTLKGFTFIYPPAITSFTPTSQYYDSLVTIKGHGLTGATSVTFGGTSALSFTVQSDSVITTIVGTGKSGAVVVNTPYGTDTLVGFNYLTHPPTITSVSPNPAGLGQQVTVVGTNLINIQSVTIGGLATEYIPQNAETILLQLNAGSVPGVLSITTAGGTAIDSGFTFIPPPAVLYRFSPSVGDSGTQVTIFGSELLNLSGVSFGGVPATSFTAIGDSEIVAIVGRGASGNVVVTTTGGSDTLNGFTYTAPPPTTIISLTPDSAREGATVLIRGTGFTGTTLVSFLGTPPASFTVLSDSVISAVIGDGSTGKMTVESPSGIAHSYFTYIGTPTITSFSPTVGDSGSTVVINVADAESVTSVSFGGIPAKSFTITGGTSISAVVGNGASGYVTVANAYGSDSLAGFTYAPPPPAVSGFTPNTAMSGTLVQISGTNFTGATAVSFGGTPAVSFNVVSASLIDAVVGTGANGDVTVTTPGGSDSVGVLIYYPGSITPNTATSGTTVTIRGVDFTGATGVTFGGTPAASFDIVHDSVITAVVGSGSSGAVIVTSPYGNLNAGNFTYTTSAPTITSFTPANAPTDSLVSITGTNFTGVTAVSFGGTPAASFTVISSTYITAIVGSGASGNVSVTADGGTATLGGFTYDAPPPAPAITSFTPATGSTDSVVTIIGSNFTGATAVSFGGTGALSFTIVSATSITAVVGSGASGNVSVTTAGGTATLGGFIYVAPPPAAPTITSFTPANAPTDSLVSIVGTNFTGVTAVSFGGTPAASFTVVSSGYITAIVGAGASGNVSVTADGGTATLGGFTYDTPPPAPAITSFTPATGSTDSVVTITGSNFTGATAVSFGGTGALSFTIVSATSITAVVGSGASGNVSVTTAGGTATLGGFTYIAPAAAAPTITSFTPDNAPTDSLVSIVGTNFTGVTAVSFGGTSAASFTVVSSGYITAIVGAGASGNISVTADGGTAALGGFTYDGPAISPSFTLLQFTGALVSNQAQLKWQTQNEQSISNYVIERSQDSLTFTAIGTQQPQHTGSVTNSYTFTDPNLQAGKNYYQLQIMDTSGNAVPGGVVEVSLPGSKNAVTLYPNPAKGVVNITVPSSAKTSTLQVVDLHGNVFATITVAPNTSQVTVDFTGATTGFYILSWNDGTRKLVKKIMVIN